jgi:chondroitin AC lyase
MRVADDAYRKKTVLFSFEFTVNMRRSSQHLIALILVFTLSQHIYASPATDSLIDRYRQYLLQTEIDSTKALQLFGALKNGQWPDIDYQNKDRGNWKTRDHLLRLQMLCIAWAKAGNQLSGKPAVLESLLQATDHWLDKKYQNSNWWQNEIGVPQLMRDIMILLRDRFDPERWKKALSILGQHKVRGTGANLTWSADLGLHYAAFTNDQPGIDSCQKLLVREIMISTKEGIQPDHSFHQHGARLQNYHYGRAFLMDNTRLAWQCRNTAWAFSEDKVLMLAGLLLEGDQWMTRGKHVSPAVIDRAISRADYLDTGDLTLTAIQLKDLVPSKRKQLDIAIASYKGTYPDMGYKHFPYSDYAAYSSKDYSFYLKTISTRTLPSETTINSENLHGHLLNGGNTYFIKNGREYTNLMPAWDWNKLPGITNFNGNARLVPQIFNGGTGNGKNGCWATDHSLVDGDRKLSAHKFWAVHNNVVVCLIAGLNTTGDADSVFTVMDQSRLQGNIASNKPGNIIAQGLQQLNGINWIYHAGFAYAPLYKETLLLQSGSVYGSWYTINQNSPDTPVHDKIFMPLLLHDKKARSSGYVVTSTNSAVSAGKIFSKPNWQVISNTAECQAVSFDQKILMAAFFKPGTVKWKNSTIVTNRPCILQIDETNIYVSDPEHKGGNIEISIGRKHYKLTLLKTGETAIEHL